MLEDRAKLKSPEIFHLLKSLDLSDNLIEDLEENSFVDIINLENLDLSHNRLTDLRRGAVHR